MKILKIAAFTDNNQGGNPAGVIIFDELPAENEMLDIAKQVGYSETAFLKPFKDGWRIRYFSPEMEVPFCGHATIASGSVIGERFGEGAYTLYLNTDTISVAVTSSETGRHMVALQSPGTWSDTAPREVAAEILDLFGLSAGDLDPDFPIRLAFAGAKHLIVVVNNRKTLAAMDYDFEKTKAIMRAEDIATISLLWRESDGLFHSRNAFAPGGVYEDPATGAAAAALAGYLRDIGWKGNNKFEIIQGEDMGFPSRLFVEYTEETGSSVKVAGETRHMEKT